MPKQHGVWAMLVAPWLVGATLRARAGGPAWGAELALLAFWVAGYLTFQAASGWLKAAPSRRAGYGRPVLAYGAVATVLGVVALVLLGPGTLWWVPWFLPLLAVALRMAATRRERSLLGGVATVAAASLLGLVARYPQPQPPDPVTAAAVGACFAYFLGTVLYVKTMIRERGEPRYLALSLGYHAAVALLAAAGWAAGGPAVLAPLAGLFAAATLRSWLMPRLGERRPVKPLHVGLVEIGFSVALVAVCLVAG